MNSLSKIIISGPRTAGKTTLLHLLDGENNLVNYKHDKFLLLFDKLFIEQNKIDKLKDLIRKKSIIIKSRYLKKNKYLNIHNFKKFLYEIGYSWIESDALYYETPAHFSVKSFHKITKHNFKFNFENFDKTIKNKIFCSNKKTFYFEELVDIYLKSYVENSKNKKKNKIKTIVFKSPNELTTIENCANEILSCKIIYVKRDCLGLLKSRALDLKIREKGKDINIYFQRVLFSKYLDNIKFSYQKINQLQKKFPKKLFITSLEKIIFNRFEEVTNILKFLRLKKKQIYFKPSFNNKKVDDAHIKKINDDDIYISKKMINFFNLRNQGLKYYLDNPSEISLSNFFKFLYIKLKFLFQK